MKLIVFVLAGLLGATSLAHAEDGPDRRADRRQRMLERFDVNQDGQLDRRERRQAKRMRRQMKLQKMIRKFDTNGDGNLGPGELPEKMQRKLRRFDRNGDGWIDGSDTNVSRAAPRSGAQIDQRDRMQRGQQLAPATPPAADQE
jgi:Ca2+-binding EF-hand superfamily protein